MEPDHLTTFQVEVARIFFGLKASGGYLVAGGAALLASDLIARPTEDLELFGPRPITSVIEAKNALLRTLQRRGCKVTVVQDGPTFCRMVVERSAEEVLVDLAIDSPPRNAPTVTVLGPTLAPLELAGRKLLALCSHRRWGRARTARALPMPQASHSPVDLCADVSQGAPAQGKQWLTQGRRWA